MSWITESHRMDHFKYAIPIGLIGTILMVIGVAFGLEFKDKLYGNSFDWLDISSILLGGLIGLILQIILLIIIL